MLEGENIVKIKGILKPHIKDVQSIIVIGSVATGTDVGESDIDIVVMTGNTKHSEISDYLMEAWMADNKYQWICLSSKMFNKMLSQGSPLVYAIRHGIVLKDEFFYLKGLLREDYPLHPTGGYYSDAFRELIAHWYYYVLYRFEAEIARDHAPGGICHERCKKHAPADIFASLIMRMLYVTLPYRGLMPLCKADVLKFAKETYGESAAAILEKVFDYHRKDIIYISSDEYRLLKPFAVSLFREVLRIVGLNEETLKTLKLAAASLKDYRY